MHMRANTMMSTGYRELEHTADWALEVWAPDVPALLEAAARGMYALSGARLKDGPRLRRSLDLRSPDAEALLVAFLEELLYLGEMEGAAFERFDLRVAEDGDGFRLQASLEGAPLAEQKKEIKAVTWHNLTVRRTARGLETTLVFDV